MSLILRELVVGSLEENCYLLGCPETKKAVVIDPGDDAAKISRAIDKLGLQPEYIINTHGHGDHIGANDGIKTKYGAKILISAADSKMLTDARENLTVFFNQPIVSPPADKLLNDGDKIFCGTLEIDVIHTPGHTPGGISLKIDNLLFTGDTLFAGSVGRSDFPGGSHKQLVESIKGKLLVFDDNTKVFPGHGPSTTIGIEKRTNPYL